MISDNVIAVRLNHLLGPQDVANHAEKFGFKNIEPILSLPWGPRKSLHWIWPPLIVFLPMKEYSRPRYILKVMDRYGQVLEESDSQQRRVVSPRMPI